MPTPWTDMVDAHRRDMHEAILDATAALVNENGLDTVTLTQIARKAGVTEARLVRYFPDVDAVLRAWHQRQVGQHLAYLDDTREQPGEPIERLEAVLRAYAVLAHQSHRHHAAESAAALHKAEHLANAQRHLHGTIRELIVDCVATGDVRDDVSPDELVTYCLHALTAASGHGSADAVRRLITITLAGIRKQ